MALLDFYSTLSYNHSSFNQFSSMHFVIIFLFAHDDEMNQCGT